MSFANRLFFSLYCSAPIIKQSDLYIFLYIKIFLLLRVLDLLFSYSVFKVHGTLFRPFSILLNTEYYTQFSQVQYSLLKWWAQVDSNHRPRAYQARALTN